jgi:hypothetical protein
MHFRASACRNGTRRSLVAGRARASARTAGRFSGHTTESMSASQITWDFCSHRSR